jgi:hypothetical protein
LASAFGLPLSPDVESPFVMLLAWGSVVGGTIDNLLVESSIRLVE